MTGNYNKNHAIRIIYNGFEWLVDIIDWLGFEYMIDWRNDIMKWRLELVKKYKWLE